MDKDEVFGYWTCESVKLVSCGESSTSGKGGGFGRICFRLVEEVCGT